MSTIVVVPEIWMRASEAFARQSVDGWRTGRKSRALSMDGAELNVDLQTMGRIAECAVCLWAGLNPGKILDWSDDFDCGSDLVLQGFRFDIKASRNGSQYLIWPISKNNLFDAKAFDALGFVRVDHAHCELVGWTDKEIFRIHHEIAPEHHKLKCGTWFMHQSRLYPFDREAWGIA
jgi:hypothetical protein